MAKGRVVVFNKKTPTKDGRSLCPHKKGQRPSNCNAGPPCSGSSVCKEHPNAKGKCVAKGSCPICTPNNFCGCKNSNGNFVKKSICKTHDGKSFCKYHEEYLSFTCPICPGKGRCDKHKDKNNMYILKNSCIRCERLDCLHNIPKISCDECRGTAFCKHERIKYGCKYCGGSAVCDHKRIQSKCGECKGNSICKIHNVRKANCSCGGSAFCLIHPNVEKYRCKECGGAGICVHNKRKEYCNDPNCGGGSALCCVPGCDKMFIKKFRGHCYTCFISVFPEEKIHKNYKTKEFAVVSYIKNEFPDMAFTNDKIIQGGSSLFRPDIFIDLITYVIIVEVDEHAHNGYNETKEQGRIDNILVDVAHRPIVFIRFNPDSNSIGPSCWTYDSEGKAVVKAKCAKEWQDRLEELKTKIGFWKNTIPDKKIVLIKLFF